MKNRRVKELTDQLSEAIPRYKQFNRWVLSIERVLGEHEEQFLKAFDGQGNIWSGIEVAFDRLHSNIIKYSHLEKFLPDKLSLTKPAYTHKPSKRWARRLKNKELKNLSSSSAGAFRRARDTIKLVRRAEEAVIGVTGREIPKALATMTSAPRLGIFLKGVQKAFTRFQDDITYIISITAQE